MNPAHSSTRESNAGHFRPHGKLQQFVEANPSVPNWFALAGLGLIAWYLAPLTNSPIGLDRGRFVESIGAITGSTVLAEWASWLRAGYHASVPDGLRFYLAPLLNPALYLVVPFLLLLEYLFPADPDQPIFSKPLFQDLLWFAVRLPTDTLIVGTCLSLVQGFYDARLSFLTVTSATQWPAYLQVWGALFLGEFVFWFSHLVRHNVAAFWSFHAVHHSQKQLNFATDDRTHFGDQLISSLVMVIPLLMFQVADLKTVGVIVLYRSLHNRFIHSNLKLNLGWLGWVIASPQFHRVHHSVDPAHADKNFGGFFSIFDYAFGTAYPSRSVYPATGIADAAFPYEDRSSARQLPLNWLRQTIYPFSKLWKRAFPS
jgi:sterol desaturase/sphingolipid hydroxylase (fatty acid hydroxylase superfamily)